MSAERRREFTVAEVALLAADALGVAEVKHARVRRWIHDGRIQRNACGRIDGESVLRYLESRQEVDLDEDDELAQPVR